MEVFIHLKIGLFSINKEVFPIGICLYGPIKGTKLNSKLNLLIRLVIVFIIRIKIIIVVTLPITKAMF